MKKQEKKKGKGLKVLLFIVLGITLLWTAFGLIPPKSVLATDNPFIIEDGSYPIIAAHRGGRYLQPENTIKAFDYSTANFGVTMLETDLRMTKDNILVLMHDATVDRTSDIENYPQFTTTGYYVNNLTLDDLNHLNFGYDFTNSSGSYPYRTLLSGMSWGERYEALNGTDENYNVFSIVTCEEFFARYGTSYLYSVEIKDSGDLGKSAVDELYALMVAYGVTSNVVVGTFHDEIEKYISETYPDIMTGASTTSAAIFFLTQTLGVNIFDKINFCCLQVPTAYDLNDDDKDDIFLAKKTYVKRAHKRGISVQFWTINDEDEMRELIELGADVIMTDKPDVFFDLINSMATE